MECIAEHVITLVFLLFFFFSSRRRHTRLQGDWSSDVCSSDLDYGIGFGKSVAQNFSLLARQQELLGLDFPLLAGWSRKGSLGQVSGLAQGQRMVPSVAAALLAGGAGGGVGAGLDLARMVGGFAARPV